MINNDNTPARIILARHGQVFGNLEQYLYWVCGDSGMPMTLEGHCQTLRQGQKLAEYYTQTATKKWPKIVVTPHYRTHQTASEICVSLKEIFNGEPEHFKANKDLIEKYFAAKNTPKSYDWEVNKIDDVLREFGTNRIFIRDVWPKIEDRLNELNPNDPVYFGVEGEQARAEHLAELDRYLARNPAGGSIQDNVANIKRYINGRLADDHQKGIKDHLLVTHGASIKTYLLVLFDLKVEDYSKIDLLSNAGLIVLEKETPDSPWTAKVIYNGDKPIEKINPIEGLYPMSFKDLPAPSREAAQILGLNT